MKLRKTIVYALMALFLLQITLAVPQTLPLQLENFKYNTGVLLNESHNLSINIYNVSTSGSSLYEKNFSNQTFDVGDLFLVLPDVNLTGDEQYYVGINIDDKGEILPIVNISSVPYAFRSNFSEDSNKLDGQLGAYYLDDTDTNLTDADIADLGYIKLANVTGGTDTNWAINTTVLQNESGTLGIVLSFFTNMFYLKSNPLGFFSSEGNLTDLLDNNYADIAVVDTDTNITGCTDCIDGTEISVLTDADISNTLTASILTDDDTYALTASAETFDEDITFSKDVVVTQNLTVTQCILFSSGGKICDS